MRYFAAFVLSKWRSTSFLGCFLAGAFLTPFGFAYASAPEPFERNQEGLLFTLQGSNTVGAHLAPAWVKSFLEAKGAKGVFVENLPRLNEYRIKGRNGTRMVFIDVHAHGSSTGFKGLKSGQAAIALSSRNIKPQEVTELKALGEMQSANAEHVVAIDGLAVIVHPSNALAQLPVNMIGQIFGGNIKNWKDLGGPDRAINIYARDDQSGTYDTFKSLVLGKQFKLTQAAQRFESNDELSDRVANDVAGIGFVGLASVRKAKALAVSAGDAKALKPEVIYVATEDYPLSRRLYMYTPEEVKQPFVSEFIAFTQGSAGQKIVESIGFVSQNPKSAMVELTSGPSQYQALAKYANRLSLNFRFQPGRADLDNKALQDVKRLARFVIEQSDQNMNIQLVGFSNTESTQKRAQVLSRLRATAVKSALYRYGVRTDSVIGFGDTLRVADTEGGAAIKNERVEVWVYPSALVNEVKSIREQASAEELISVIAL